MGDLGRDELSMALVLGSDLGELFFLVATVHLTKTFQREDLEKVLSIAEGECIVAVVNATKLISPRQLIYPAYLALRNRSQGISVAKDVNVETVALAAGTRQIKQGLSLMDPTNSRLITILVAGPRGKCSIDWEKFLKSLRYIDENCDIFIGAASLRIYSGEWKNEEEFTNKLINNLLEQYT